MLLTVISLAGKAQEKTGFGFYTDRDVYVSGETVLSKMFIPSANSSGIAHFDLVNKAAGTDLFKKEHHIDATTQLKYAEKLGLGQRKYEIVDVD